MLLEKTDPKLVWMELDLFWIRKGGRDPLDYFRRYPNRYRLVHIKDMAVDGTMADIGKGAMNWTELLGAARKAGVQHFLAEHDGAAMRWPSRRRASITSAHSGSRTQSSTVSMVTPLTCTVRAGPVSTVRRASPPLW